MRSRSGSRSRSRSAGQLYAPSVRARHPQGRPREARAYAEPARHQGALQAGPADFRRQGQVQSAAPVQDGARQGLSVRRRRNPLALRQGAAARHRGRAGGRDASTSPTASRTISPPPWPGRRSSIPTSSPASRAGRAPTARSNGRSPGVADADGFLSSYCNTIPTADGGTHESGLRTALLRALKDHAERIGQGKRARTGDERGRHDRGRRDALGVHPRAGIPGPDQGPAGDRGGRRASSKARSRTSSTTGSPATRPRRTGCSTGSSSAPTSASAAARRRRSRASPRRASCACPASSPTAPTPRPKARKSSSSRAIPPAAPPSRRATGRARRSCRCAARSSTSPAPARTSSPRTSSSPTSSRRSAAAPAPITATRTCATRRSSS